MAKKGKKEEKEEKGEKEEPKPAPESASPMKEMKKGFISILSQELMQNILLGIMLIFGIRRQPFGAMGNAGNQDQPAREKEGQVPDWVLSAFPDLTRDDDNEYNLALDSHPEPNARTAAKEFRTSMVSEGIYDDVRYIVNLIKIRREYMERMKNPLPEDKSGGRLKFGEITLKDSVNEFFSELLAEKNVIGRSPEQVYEYQKERARERNLLPKKHLLKRIREWTSTHKAETFVGIILLPFVFFKIIIWLLGG